MAAGITALLCGIALGETDLVRVGVLLLAVPLAAALVVRRARVSLASRREIRPPQASAGEAVLVGLDVTNRSVLRTGALMLEDQLPAQLDGRARFVLDGLAGKQRRTVSYRLAALGRGRYRVGPLQVRMSDPFGLVQVRHSFAAVDEFVISPVVELLAPFEPPRSRDLGADAGSHSIGAHGADAASTREYRTGDPLRKVHWRSTARSARLMVRQEEQPWQGSATLLLDLRASAHAATAGGARGGDPRARDSLEWAVSAAASIGTRLLLSGQRVGVVTEAREPGVLRPGGPAQLRELLAEVAASGEQTLSGVRGLIQHLAREGAITAILGRRDAESLQMLAACDGRGAANPPMALLLDTPTWAGAEPEPAGGGCHAAAQVLRDAGWRVAIAHRGHGVARAWQTLLQGRTAPAMAPAPDPAAARAAP
jgi:uncharacterized protein (DUF58 family)